MRVSLAVLLGPVSPGYRVPGPSRGPRLWAMLLRRPRRGESVPVNVSVGDKRMTWRLDATSLSALLDARETTPLRLLEQSLARLDALEPVLNAFTHVDREGALAAAT